MGGYLSREWSEVMTSASPGSPSDGKQETVPIEASAASIARRRIVDPRSLSDDVTRTPIQVEKLKSDDSTPRVSAPPMLDPRSPSTALPRTPIAPSAKMNFDDAIETEAKDPVVKLPVRGAVAAELQEIERKIQNVKVVDEEVADDKDGKEEGELTDSDEEKEEANDENAIVLPGTTPKTKRTKSMLESDCRSPLLIESDEPSAFDKALAMELDRLAAKGMVANKRRPLGEKADNKANDSLVI